MSTMPSLKLTLLLLLLQQQPTAALTIPTHKPALLAQDASSLKPSEHASLPAAEPAATALPRVQLKALPGWAATLNEKMEMPLVTFADKHHVHAVSGALWMLCGYGVLFSAWGSELAGGDYASALTSAYGSLSPLLALTTLSGVAVGLTGFPMRPKRRFRAYANQMRNAMTSTALLSLMAASFALDASGGLGDGSALSDATRAVVAVGAAYMGREAVMTRTPWDITNVVRDLKLEQPPEAALYAARAIGLGWLAMAAATACHCAPLPWASADLDPTTSAFAAQMALALAMAPSSEALVGTLCMKDRFTKADDAHVFVTRTPSGGLRPSHWLEALELALNVPGPALLTVLIAIYAGHADLVRAFFFLQ